MIPSRAQGVRGLRPLRAKHEEGQRVEDDDEEDDVEPVQPHLGVPFVHVLALAVVEQRREDVLTLPASCVRVPAF